jgi:menaquinone-dependent protoporphyrinogen oxidase
MKVLITVASRHEATRGIAEVIADELRTSGLDVDLFDAEAVPDVGAYEAVILGSAVYTGEWLSAAKHLVDFQGAALRKLPVWLFSSGPIGTAEAQTLDDPPEVQLLMRTTGAREHRVFGGRLDKQRLEGAERSVRKVIDAPQGDYRDLGMIIEWARSIALSLERMQETQLERGKKRDQ